MPFASALIPWSSVAVYVSFVLALSAGISPCAAVQLNFQETAFVITNSFTYLELPFSIQRLISPNFYHLRFSGTPFQRSRLKFTRNNLPMNIDRALCVLSRNPCQRYEPWYLTKSKVTQRGRGRVIWKCGNYFNLKAAVLLGLNSTSSSGL